MSHCSASFVCVSAFCAQCFKESMLFYLPHAVCVSLVGWIDMSTCMLVCSRACYVYGLVCSLLCTWASSEIDIVVALYHVLSSESVRMRMPVIITYDKGIENLKNLSVIFRPVPTSLSQDYDLRIKGVLLHFCHATTIIRTIRIGFKLSRHRVEKVPTSRSKS